MTRIAKLGPCRRRAQVRERRRDHERRVRGRAAPSRRAKSTHQNRRVLPASVPPLRRARAGVRRYGPTPACRFRGHPHSRCGASCPLRSQPQAAARPRLPVPDSFCGQEQQPRLHQKKPRAGGEQGPCALRGTAWCLRASSVLCLCRHVCSARCCCELSSGEMGTRAVEVSSAREAITRELVAWLQGHCGWNLQKFRCSCG